MKKLLSITAALLLAMLTCVPAYAAETIGEAPGSADISVYARYVDAMDFTAIPIDEQGGGSVTLPDGTVITISGADATLGRIVVEEVTDKEVLDWAASLLRTQSNGFRLFYVWQLTKSGTVQSVSGITVTVQTAENTADTVYALNGDQCRKLDVAAKRGTITFTTDDSPFYALCNGAKTTVSGEKSPKTGDNANLTLALALLFSSCGAGILAAVCGRKKNTV